MERELFKEDQTTKEIAIELAEFIKENSSMLISGNGSIELLISENGHAAWWMDDLLDVILRKVEKCDHEMVAFCMKRNINLFNIETIKRIPTK